MSLEHGGSRQRRAVRAALVARDGNLCHLCGGPVNLELPPEHELGPTIDHVRPRALGGGDGLDNLKLAHKRCNQDRDVKPVRERRQPRAHPVVPRGMHPKFRKRKGR